MMLLPYWRRKKYDTVWEKKENETPQNLILILRLMIKMKINL